MTQLNFDFGIKGTYRKSVIHFLPDFLGTGISKTKEFENIESLFHLCEYGIVFGKSTKERVGEKILELHKKNGLDRLTELLSILDTMALQQDYTLLHEKLYLPSFGKKEKLRLKTVNLYLAKNYVRKITLTEISEVAGMTVPAFCRYFKKMTKLTFSSFLNQYRIDIAKKLLLNGRNVSEACFESGFQSLSYFNRTFKRISNQNPSLFQRQLLLD
jgi:AraC-like DNA-binding protein